MTDREVMQQALEALRSSTNYRSGSAIQVEAVENLCEALEQPERKPLTLDEIAEVAERMEATDAASSFWRDFARAIEAAHNIKEQS
jgi:hypothetical protein